MTTILAAAAIVLFAILIAVCVFCLLEYLRLSKDDEQKDEVKARPGKYSNIADFDIQSIHPSSCISEKPFPDYTSKYQPNFEKASKEIQDRLLEDKVGLNFREHYEITKRIEKLEKLVQQLYTDRDEDVNKIADQINRHEDMISDLKEDGE